MTTLIRKQIAPVANTATTLYTAPANCVISSIIVCNRSTTPDNFTIYLREAGAVVSTASHIYTGVALAGADSFIQTAGLVILNTDIIDVVSLNGTSTFHLFGEEQ